MKFWEFSFYDLFKMLGSDLVIYDKANNKIVLALVYSEDKEGQFDILQEKEFLNHVYISKEEFLQEMIYWNTDKTPHTNSFIAETANYGIIELEH